MPRMLIKQYFCNMLCERGHYWTCPFLSAFRRQQNRRIRKSLSETTKASTVDKKTFSDYRMLAFVNLFLNPHFMPAVDIWLLLHAVHFPSERNISSFHISGYTCHEKAH